jgi:hypothetical protein
MEKSEGRSININAHVLCVSVSITATFEPKISEMIGGRSFFRTGFGSHFKNSEAVSPVVANGFASLPASSLGIGGQQSKSTPGLPLRL